MQICTLSETHNHASIPPLSFLQTRCPSCCLTNSVKALKAISICYFLKTKNTHTHTTVLLLCWNLSGTTRVSRYQKGKTRKGKTNLDLLEQEIVTGSGICWAICKSAPHPTQPRQHPTTQFFTGRMPFLPPNQQRQSTEGESTRTININGNLFFNYNYWFTSLHKRQHPSIWIIC